MAVHVLQTMPAMTILLASFAHYFFGITLSLTAIFLILLVLVQRGRGGGLAGAFGGMGGQSAFGTKAGDTFTKVTIGVSIFWILLCIASVKLLGTSAGVFGQAGPPEQTQFMPGPGAEPIDSTLPEMPGDQLPAEPAASEPTDGEATPASDTGGSATDGEPQ